MSFIEVSLWDKGQEVSSQILLCEKKENADMIFTALRDAIDKILDDNNDIAEVV